MVFTWAEHVLAIVGACALVGMIHHAIDQRLEEREQRIKIDLRLRQLTAMYNGLPEEE